MSECKIVELSKDYCEADLNDWENGEGFYYWIDEFNSVFVEFLTLLKETDKFYYVIVKK